MYRCAIGAFVAAALIHPACAQVQRNFPQNALRGTLAVGTPPEVLLNGQVASLAPGARIRGQENMVVLSGALVGAKLVVNYTVDTHGLVKDVWILRAEEAASWQFDRAAQTWTKP